VIINVGYFFQQLRKAFRLDGQPEMEMPELILPTYNLSPSEIICPLVGYDAPGVTIPVILSSDPASYLYTNGAGPATYDCITNIPVRRPIQLQIDGFAAAATPIVVVTLELAGGTSLRLWALPGTVSAFTARLITPWFTIPEPATLRVTVAGVASSYWWTALLRVLPS